MPKYIPPISPKTGRYSPDESEAVQRYVAAGLLPAEIAVRINRTAKSVRNFVWERGWTHPEQWSADEVRILRETYAAHQGVFFDRPALAARLGRTENAVQCKAEELGLTDPLRRKTPEGWKRKNKRYANREEWRADLSRVYREWHQNNPHPRGFAGHKHTDEAKKRMATVSRRSPEQLSIDARKAVQTRIARYGTGGPVHLLAENAYSRAAGGKRADLDNRYFRSAWEANYARYLNWLVEQGEIQAWEYEPETFVFHGVTRGALTYTPDFRVTERDGSVCFHEVKGWMDSKSRTKLKRMAKWYPEHRVIVIGPSEYAAISKWRDLIPNWERGKHDRA